MPAHACAPCGAWWAAVALLAAGPAAAADATPLGLPELPVPEDNPITPQKVSLGDKLFHDTRFSSTGTVSCATCHDRAKAFTDGPLKTSRGVNDLTGTRNAPTVANAAYFQSFFWDGRSPTLEDQSLHPFVNPVEMALQSHEPLLKTVRSDSAYVAAFKEVFGIDADQITMKEVSQAIATFERTLLFGNSPFDRYYFGGDKNAMSASAIRGFEVFLEDGRCVSCHTIEQDHALFTDHRFHNVGVGITAVQDDAPKLARAFLKAKVQGVDVDKAVLSDAKTSELGRFAVTDTLDDMGAFKTSTLRNIAVTAPFMHDGSLATLRDVVEHYNNGGVTDPNDRFNDYLSGGIRPLDLTEAQMTDLVAFLEALTSPEYAMRAAKSAANCNLRTPTRTAHSSPVQKSSTAEGSRAIASVSATAQPAGITP